MREFKLAQPKTIDEATYLLSIGKEKYSLVAGGTDILDLLKNEIIEPEVVVDLGLIPGLSLIKKEREGVRIGAMTRISQLVEDEMIKNDYPVLYEAARSVGTPQLRNLGTVGGNLCQRPRCWYFRSPELKCRKKGGSKCYAIQGRNKYHALLGSGICHIVYPSDLAPALISLEAEAIINSPGKEKSIPLEEFYLLPQKSLHRENILGPDEVLKEIRIPQKKGKQRSLYVKFKERGAWDFAVVSVALAAVISNEVFEELRIVLGGVAPIPWRLKNTEEKLKGRKVDEELAKQVVREALMDARPLKENGYKKELAEVLLYRALLSL